MTNDAKAVFETLRELIRQQLGKLNEHEQISVALHLRDDIFEFLRSYGIEALRRKDRL